MANGHHRSAPGLIVTRTPLRISFAGGGTDLPVFCAHEYGGVLSTTIDKYLYVTLKRHGDLYPESIRLNYSETEQTTRVDDISNDIMRECIRFLEIEPPIYVSTVADLPAGSGLGSSSSFAVGLLNALHAYRGEIVSAGQLAEEAAYIEIEVLKRPIGKQDHYAAAFGGFNFLVFQSTGSVSVEPQSFVNHGLNHLFTHMMVFWTAVARDVASVLSEQQSNTKNKMPQLVEMREHARQLQALIRNGFDPAEFGRLVDSSWQLKRQLATTITNDRIDGWYRLAMEAGAFGGKLCGAGGGGFLMFIVAPERQADVRQALGELSEVPVQYEPRGSMVLIPHVE